MVIEKIFKYRPLKEGFFLDHRRNIHHRHRCVMDNLETVDYRLGKICGTFKSNNQKLGYFPDLVKPSNIQIKDQIAERYSW